MKRNLLQLCVNIGLASVIGVAGCAGTLTDDEQQRLWLEHTGGTGGGTGSMTSGSGGGGPMVDMCVVSTATTGPMHTCQGTGCHSSAASAAMLNLENDNLTKNYKTMYYNVDSKGDPTGVAPVCTAGMAKLIDGSNAMNSLIYTKLVATGDTNIQPCGSKMPFFGTLTTQEKACILSWINSVIAASQ